MRVSLWAACRGALVSGALLACALLPAPADAQEDEALAAEVDRLAERVMPKVVTWRRDVHQNPELGNREFRTSELVAAHLRSLGMEVRTGVAHTGVVAVLRGGRPGPVVALRADMDALPVSEQVDLPFASKVRTEYNGQDVGVMHACGHDNHVAILMGVAEVLAGMKDRLPGTVKFIFQPAEEGSPAGEEGGADLMLEEGAFADPVPDVVFGLHVFSNLPVGHIGYVSGGAMAAADGLRITVHGRQTHAAMPWDGVDPIVTASQIVLGLQTIVSRQSRLTVAPAVVTVGTINGGVRSNIIPDSVTLAGTIRTLDEKMRMDIHDKVKRTAEGIAAAAGARANVRVSLGLPVTVNDPALTSWAAPMLERIAGPDKAYAAPPSLGAEDFSYYAQRVPGLFLFLGVTPEGQDPATAPANHSPLFFADEGALPVGVRALANLAVEYMAEGGPTRN
jgi:amidohydrolase